MCGFAGIYYYKNNRPASGSLIRRMTDLLSHRGPDGEGIYINGSVGLGHRRLAILDLSSAGQQPMTNEDSSVWIVYNGECYNFKSLRDELKLKGHIFKSTSDTEVILHLYEEDGPACVKRLQGMFAFALWDQRKKLLMLARDRIGIKPLFYFDDGYHISFGSELKALMPDPDFSRELDKSSFCRFVQLLSVPGPGTIYRNARKLEPGHFLIAEKQQIRVEKYWDVLPKSNLDLNTGDIDALFCQYLDHAVDSHLVSDVPVGAFLSGGIDSSCVCAMASRLISQPLKTFSVAFPEMEEDESPVAKVVAKHIDSTHFNIPIQPDLIETLNKVSWHMDEPFGVPSAFATYHLAYIARQHVKVVLTGDGADEIFAGYPWRHCKPKPVRNWDSVPAFLRFAIDMIGEKLETGGILLRTPIIKDVLNRISYANLSAGDVYAGSRKSFHKEDLVHVLSGDLWLTSRQAWRDNLIQYYYNIAVGNDDLTCKLYADTKTSLVDEMLTKVDRMTMAHGLEARVPFLDHPLVEWAFTIPSEHKVQKNECKILIRRAMQNFLPDDILKRPKHGFVVPVGTWFRNELKDFLQDHLLSREFLQTGMFRKKGIQKILKEHTDGLRDFSLQLFTLLAFCLWQKNVHNAIRPISPE